MRWTRWAAMIGAALMCSACACFAQQGDVRRVHDPSAIAVDGTVYLFCTGRGLPIRTSTDLWNWQRAGSVFPVPPLPQPLATPQGTPPPTTEPATRPTRWPANWPAGGPAWTHAYTGGGDFFWAPDISFFAGQYHVYYAASTFGSRHSAIGLVTSPTLDAARSDYHWTDRGPVIATTPADDWNAIDPAVFTQTDDGTVWLVCGSCWSGIKLLQLNPQTGLLLHPDEPPMPIAHRPGGKLLEEGYLTRRGDWYYLWASYDHCCRGARSDYRIVVGRSHQLQGPFLDHDGVSMLAGGGTTVLASTGDIRGPGSSALLPFAGKDWLIFHFYDAANHGTPTLQIRALDWSNGGWPKVGGQIAGPVKSP